jgi:hypothetical protein
VPTVRRIVVGVHGSLGSLQALRYAEAEARQRDVPLVPVIAWIPPGGDLAERRHSSPYLRKIWRDAAWERLTAAFDDGLGGMPAGLRVEPHVERGETGAVLVDIAHQPEDLPGARRPAVGADGRDESRAAVLATAPARAHPGLPGDLAPAWVPLGTRRQAYGSCKGAFTGCS